MSTVEKLKLQIQSLSSQERAELERLLRHAPGEPKKPMVLPNQAERRKRIFGNAVLPNYVLLAREGTLA